MSVIYCTMFDLF